MEHHCLAHYVRLFHANWLSTIQLSRLLKHFGTLARLLATDQETLAQFGLPPPLAERLLCSATAANTARDDRSLAWAAADGQVIITYEESTYPELLRQIDVPPPLLFVRGNTDCLTDRQLAVVGSRKASSYGQRTARWLSHELSLAGLTISSGMARGIDTCAHEGALAAGGRTIAVIGTGADTDYPPCNKALALAIANSGALVSEFPLGTAPAPHNFPRRNRIMSGLSLGTLVIEAALKSGSLITARQALEQNREVFAVPGLVSNPLAAGCHQLINSGARLVQEAGDILSELGLETDPQVASARASAAPPGRQAHSTDSLVDLIGEQGCELQSLLERTELGYQLLVERLLDLEIAGEIRTSGGRYFRA